MGSVGDSYDNALAETINGLYKAEVIHRREPWQPFEAVECATPEWVGRFNTRRLLAPIGNIPPAEAEDRYQAMLDDIPCPHNLNRMASGNPGAVHVQPVGARESPGRHAAFGAANDPTLSPPFAPCPQRCRSCAMSACPASRTSPCPDAWGFYPQDAVKACNWRRIAASSARIDRAQSPAIEKRKTG